MLSDAPWGEKRRVNRIKSSLELYYELRPEGRYGNCLTYEISEGGLRMVTDSFMPRLSRVMLRLSLDPHKVIDVVGKVAWAQRVPNSYRYQVGLEFVEVSPQNRREISGYISRQGDLKKNI